MSAICYQARKGEMIMGGIRASVLVLCNSDISVVVTEEQDHGKETFEGPSEEACEWLAQQLGGDSEDYLLFVAILEPGTGSRISIKSLGDPRKEGVPEAQLSLELPDSEPP